MEIGPITAIRPIAMIKPLTAAPDISGVFSVEFRKQAQDEAPSHQRAARGLEDEESDEAILLTAEDETAPAEAALDQQPRSRVNFFA